MKNYEGFGLIEVLIASVIIAVGLLGAATLQTASLKNLKSAENRTNAVMLAEEIKMSMFNNQAESSQGTDSRYVTYNIGNSNSNQDQVAINKCISNEGCTSKWMSTMELVDWNNNLKHLYNEDAEAVICFDSAKSDTTMNCDNDSNYSGDYLHEYTVKIKYRDSDGEEKIYLTDFSIPK